MQRDDTPDATRIDALRDLIDAGPAERVERVLRTAREILGMEVAYFSEIVADEQIIRSVDGEDSFGFGPGTTVPLDDTYCSRMLAGEIPSVIGDTRSHECLAELPGTAASELAAYIGVPLVLPDGRVYGTLCCASHVVHEELGDRELRFMQVLSRLLADDIALDELRKSAQQQSDRLTRTQQALQLNAQLAEQLVIARYHLAAGRTGEAEQSLDAAIAGLSLVSAELLPDGPSPGELRLPS